MYIVFHIPLVRTSCQHEELPTQVRKQLNQINHNKRTFPLKTGATSLKILSFDWKSSDFLLMNSRACSLMSPAKIFEAAS